MDIITTNEALILGAILLWTLPWKGYALWTAARKGDKYWFVAILILNTLAILDILYIFFFSKKWRSMKNSTQENTNY